MNATPAPTVVALASGGLDSTVMMAHYLERGHNVWPLFVWYGQRTGDDEWFALARVLDALEAKYQKGLMPPWTMNIEGMPIGGLAPGEVATDAPGGAYVPGRNLVMIALATSLADSLGEEVVVGIGATNVDASAYDDVKPSFIRHASEAAFAASCVTVQAPLSKLTKAGVWNLADDLGIRDLVIASTRTCYNAGGDQHPWGFGCATCESCLGRAAGYHQHVG